MTTGRYSKQSCQIIIINVLSKTRRDVAGHTIFLKGPCRYLGDKICTVHVEISSALNSHFTHNEPRLASNIPQTNDCFEGNIMPSDSLIGNKIVEICILLWSRISPYRACTWRLACHNLRLSFSGYLRTTGKDFLKPLFLADVRGVGTRDEPQRASTCEANSLVQILFTCCK